MSKHIENINLNQQKSANLQRTANLMEMAAEPPILFQNLFDHTASHDMVRIKQ